MSSNHSKDQFSYFQPNTTNITSQSNLEQAAESSTVNNPYVTSMQHAGIQPNQHYDAMMVQFPQSQPTFQHHSIAFFYQPPNDFCNYHIECREISSDIVIQLLNESNGNALNPSLNQSEYIFFYQ